MFHRSVVAWVVNLCPFLRLSQAKALAAISWGAMKCRRVSQADVGRAMATDTVAKYNIKRVSRFVRNKRVDMAEGCRGLIAFAARRMPIEELFRDEKNIRYGWGLRQTKVGTAGRLERLLLVLAYAYFLLLLIGLVCRDTMSEAHWASGGLEIAGSGVRLHDRPLHAGPRKMAPEDTSGSFRADAHRVGGGELGMTQLVSHLTVSRLQIHLPTGHRRYRANSRALLVEIAHGAAM